MFNQPARVCQANIPCSVLRPLSLAMSMTCLWPMPAMPMAGTLTTLPPIGRPRLQPHSVIALPSQVTAGGELQGQVIPGSQVFWGKQALPVEADGKVRWSVPDHAPSPLLLRVVRPRRHPLLWRIHVHAADHSLATRPQPGSLEQTGEDKP